MDKKFVQKIPVIVGPTGSGKTGVAVEIAKEVKEKWGTRLTIISADSRTIYKGMDIGTAKPTMEERGGVKHLGFDLVEPGERFTVADWKKYAEEQIELAKEQEELPMIVGGTGLYVDALVYDYQFGKDEVGLNKKVVRDESGEYPDRKEMSDKYKMFGILWTPEELRKRLEERANKLFVQELYDETERLVSRYGWGSQAMTSNIYQFAWRYMQGEISREEAVKLSAIDDWHLAKRQMTWFRRNKNIIWLSLEKIKPAVIKCVQNEQRV